MRILHITDGIPPDTLGGSGSIVLEIAREQKKNGHEVSILTATDRNTVSENLSEIRILKIPAKPARFAHYRCVFSVSREREMLAKIQECAPDLIHAHTISRQCGYRWIPKAKALGIRIIVTSHDVSHVSCGKVLGTEKHLWLRDMLRYRWTWNPFRAPMIRRFLSHANRVLAVSDALKDFLEQHGIQNVETLRNGINLDIWKPSITKEEARTTLKLPQEKFLFLLAGRMGFDKGSTLIAATLPKSAGLMLAGNGFMEEFSNISNRLFTFKNLSSEEMRTAYAACDAVLVPSRCLDCFPTVCLEAMAMKKPVLATSMGGANESVIEGKTGWILDPWNEDAWRTRMEECITHRNELDVLGDEGRKRMESAFDIKDMTKKLENIYASLKILMLVHTLEGRDGWSRYGIDLSKALTERGHRVSAAVVKKRNTEDVITEHEILRPPLHSLSLLGSLAQYGKLRRLLRNLKPDIVHVIAEPYALPMGLMPKKHPWVLTIHGSYAVLPFSAGRFARAATMRAWKRASAIVSVSAFTKRYVQETEPTFFSSEHLEEKIRVIHNAITLKPEREKTPHTGEKRILGVGAVKARKGYLQAIRALAELKKQADIPFRYDIIGSLAETAYVDTLKRECATLGLTDRVHFHGSVSEKQLEEAYRNADAFLLLSIFEKPYVEGFVLAFLEAAAAGIPSVGPNTGGCPEAIAEGRSGYVCDPENAPVIAGKLRSILIDGSIESATCRAWAEEHDIVKAAREIESLYKATLDAVHCGS